MRRGLMLQKVMQEMHDALGLGKDKKGDDEDADEEGAVEAAPPRMYGGLACGNIIFQSACKSDACGGKPKAAPDAAAVEFVC